MNVQIPTYLLRLAREKAGVSQASLAAELSVNSSVVSRLEASEQADGKMAGRYLGALQSDFANAIVAFFSDRWRHTERPDYLHVDRAVLWDAERALQTLEEFEKGDQFDPILQDPLSKLRNRILSEVDFIRHKEHGIAFIGEIGVGKTTALSFATNLITKVKDEEPKSIFPTSSGRTTVCEVAIKIAPAFGIAVDCLTEDQIRRLVTDLINGLSKINYGQHPKFSVPQRITVLLPLKALRETPFLISVIDTKGVEGTTQRPDLMAQIEDPRTVTVLCCSFPDAPGGVPLSIIRETLDAGSDAIASERLCLLVLPRNDEALKIVNDAGDTPTDSSEGYAVREGQIEQQFATDGLPNIPVNFFQVGADEPEDIWHWLTSRIEAIRAAKVERIKRHVAAADNLVSNADVAKTRQARRTVADTIAKAAERFRTVPNVVRPAHLNLVAEAKKTHQNSIAASVNRKGNWENFPVAHILGQGVRIDVNLRTRDVFVRVDEAIEGLKDDFAHLNDVAQFLENLKDDVEEWRKDFLARVALAGRNLFTPYLGEALEMWEQCEARYGGGSGYRVDVSGIFQTQFETGPAAMATAQKVETQVAAIWEQIIIERLLVASAFTDEE